MEQIKNHIVRDSEKLLGEIGVTHFDLITKLPPLPSIVSAPSPPMIISLLLGLFDLSTTNKSLSLIPASTIELPETLI